MLELISPALPWATAIGLTLALLILPGWGVLALARVPMRRLYGVAPPVTLAMLTVIGAATHLLGVRFDRLSAGIGIAAMLLLAAVLGRKVFHRPGEADSEIQPSEPAAESVRSRRMQVAAAVVPAVLALIVGLGWVVPSTRAIGALGEVAQSFDAFFHHSAIAEIRATGDAFPLTALAPLYHRDAVTYPIGWHSVAALLPGDAAVAANSLVLATLMLLPLTMLPMMDQVLPPGPARRASLTALMFVPSFLTFPSLTLRAGLWPYSLGVALLPALVAALLHLRDGRRADPHVGRSVLLLLATVGGTAATHPSIAFALLLIFPVLVLDAVRNVRAPASRRRGIVMLSVYAAAVILLLGISVDRYATMSAFFGRLASNDPITALGIVVTDRPNYRALPFAPVFVVIPWLLAALGVAVGIRRRSVPVIGLTVGLGAVVLVMTTALVPGPLGPLLTWPWYGDRERMGPVMAIGVVALAGVGLQEAVILTERIWRRAPSPALARAPISAVIALVLVGLGATGTLTTGRTSILAEATYHPERSSYKVYVSEDEEAFIRRTAEEIPPGSVVLGDPRDGTPLYFSLGDRAVVFSYLQPPVDVPRKRVARYADQYDEVPRVCEALGSTGADYLYRDLSADRGSAGASPQQNEEFAGIAALDVSEMELVDQEGPYALYRMDVTCS